MNQPQESQQNRDTSDKAAQFDLRQAQIGNFAPGARGSNLISGIVRDSMIIGTQNIYPQPPRDPSIPPSNITQRGSANFLGREEKLRELDDLLGKKNALVICALAGMGGIGKTELALQYALRYQDSYPGGLCWLPVRGADLGIQIVNYGRTYLGLTPPDGLELSQQVAYCWTNWREGKALIVFDDVDEYEAIKSYLPPSQTRFKVIMTSRLKPGTNYEQLNLNVLSAEDSLKLLRAILGANDSRIDDDLAQAEALCAWLGYLPLGLELVARYLTEHSSLNLKKLQERLERKKLGAAALLKEGQADMTAQLGVAAAFELSWEDLAAKATEAQGMGCILSLFAPVAFNWSWVQQFYLDTDESKIATLMALREDEADDEKFLEQNSEQWQAAGMTIEIFEEWLEQMEEAIEQLETLRDSQLIKRHLLEAVGEGQYKQHPLIREFFQAKSAQIEKMDDYRQKFCEVMVAQAKLSQTPIQTEVLAVSPAIPHITEVAKGLSQWVSEEDAIVPFVGLARFYESQSAYQEVESWYKQGLKAMRERFGEEHPAVATSLNNLAGLYYAMGK